MTSKYRLAQWYTAFVLSQIVTIAFACPWEAIKIKMQVSTTN